MRFSPYLPDRYLEDHRKKRGSLRCFFLDSYLYILNDTVFQIFQILRNMIDILDVKFIWKQEECMLTEDWSKNSIEPWNLRPITNHCSGIWARALTPWRNKAWTGESDGNRTYVEPLYIKCWVERSAYRILAHLSNFPRKGRSFEALSTNVRKKSGKYFFSQNT